MSDRERMSDERLAWIRGIHAGMQPDEFDGADEIIVECLDEIDALKAEILEAHGQVNRFAKDTVWLCAEAVERNKKIASLEAEVARLRVENEKLTAFLDWCADDLDYSKAKELRDALRAGKDGYA